MSTFKRKIALGNSLSHNVLNRKLLTSESQDKSHPLATLNLSRPPTALVVLIVLQWLKQASMPDQQRSDAEIMSDKALDLNKVTILRADQEHQSSTTMPLDPRERPRKLCFALALHATVASRTKLLTSRISMVLIEFKEATRNLFSGEVDFMIEKQETNMPVRNSALSQVVSANPTGKIHLMGLTVGE